MGSTVSTSSGFKMPCDPPQIIPGMLVFPKPHLMLFAFLTPTFVDAAAKLLAVGRGVLDSPPSCSAPEPASHHHPRLNSLGVHVTMHTRRADLKNGNAGPPTDRVWHRRADVC